MQKEKIKNLQMKFVGLIQRETWINSKRKIRYSDRAFFLNAFVLYFHLEHVQRISFCRCFLIFNPVVFCVDDGVILWLKIKNPTPTP